MTMNSRTGVAARVTAADVLHAVLQGRSLKSELAAALRKIDDPRDRALVEAICFAALRNRPRYEAALQARMRRPLGQRDAPLRSRLHVGSARPFPWTVGQAAAV